MMREISSLEAPVKPGEVSACVCGGTKEGILGGTEGYTVK